MDTASTLMGVGLLLLFIAPVGYLLYNQAFQEKKREKQLYSLAHQHGFSLNEIEHITGLSLGLDSTRKKFLLLKSGSKAKLQIIDLEKVAKIDLVQLDHDADATSNFDEVREISLQLRMQPAGSEDLNFYAEEEDPVTLKNDRLSVALKWQKILSGVNS